ncbi:uncharacterized protein PAC_10926 [Phialocephala subalpina]|uniref:DUF1772-domain-containing protein n=1 Tax=Phialocephala subalpina TaxID=576137 RepID=A0A1L7X7M7_9HELO|nr:uncharacterized protein PAC_10926 [Phialocephala subalpina]
MADISPLPIRLAQTLGLSSSLILAGQTITLSTFLIPRLLDSPTPLMLKQWNTMFQVGRKAGPQLALLSAISYFYLSYKSHLSPLPAFSNTLLSKTTSYAIAGLLSIGIVPYTLIFISGTNSKLLKKVEETKTLKVSDEVVEVGLGNESAHALVDWWGMLNLGRGALLVASGVLGAWTALN